MTDTSSSARTPSARIIEKGSGDPIVYLHGLTGIDESDPLVNSLAVQSNVIAPVAPGFDAANDLATLDDVHDLAMHYEDLLASRGLDRVALIGHSFGGMIAAELAAHYPARVSKLVLIAPLGLWDDDLRDGDLLGHSLPEMPELLWADPTSDVAAAASGSDLEPAVQVDRMIAMLQGFSAVAKFLWPLPDKGLAKRLHRITAKTLVIWGGSDRVVSPEYAKHFAEAISGAQSTVLDDAGHLVTYERTADLMGLIGEFLTQSDGATTGLQE
ncbi:MULTISPECIES: alpha/beta hydrolase [unclassified Mycobacterium]|uniref:alpha/beta fold hydrolase n=1 Tax=unclassified Mycobacterium TaxID=2642494 RepID=UPI0029C78314|nr:MULTISPECIES: alpha/beta hydrolase [unclassified Mycobacterium]